MKRDLEGERQRLEQAWATYLEVGTAEGQPRPDAASDTPLDTPPGTRKVAREIAQSWQRSSRVVTPARRTAPVDDPSETRREWRDSLLYAAAKPLLGEIKARRARLGAAVGIR